VFLSPAEAKSIASKLLGGSRADTCVVAIWGCSTANIRFAQNNATTNGTTRALTVAVRSSFGQRSGVAMVSSLDGDDIARAQMRSEEIARLSPANPEFLPPLGPQAYEPGDAAYDAATAASEVSDLAGPAKSIIDIARNRQIVAAGYGQSGSSFHSIATSAGLFAYDRRTASELTVTARNSAQTWSGWSGGAEIALASLDAARLGERAAGKANFNGVLFDLDPGQYTVVLEPAAVADLISYMFWYMDARSADEGRSFLSKKGGGTQLGEKLADERVTISTDPRDPVAPEKIFDAEGLPNRHTAWIEEGVVRNLVYSRFWARKMGRDPVPRPQNLVMKGGTATVDDMVRDTKRGILVTRLWYIRMVDPQTLLLTGLTRDGNFLIENGRIAGPARNFRFNESPLSVLNNIIAIGPSERGIGSEGDSGIAVPPLLVRNFTFSSKSSGI
jgi:predicted Zn-dependent protease